MTYQPNPFIPESMAVGFNPVYSTPAVNQVITLYDGGLELTQGAITMSGRGAVRWEWLPRPQLLFSLRLDPGDQGYPDVGKNGSLDLLGVNSKATVSVLHHSLGSHAPREIVGLVDTIEIGDTRRVKSIYFHVVNFRDCSGEPVRNEAGTETWGGRTALEVGAWRATIEKVQYSKPLFDELKSTGGFAITHIGRLEKHDRRTFSAKNSKKIFEAISVYMSFCRGAWVAPILAVGFDKNGCRVWEKWHGWRIEQWRRTGTWFNDYSDEGLSKGFPGFYQRWRDPMWKEPISLAFHWYVEANMCSGGVEGSIILAQAAFELLAWTLLVEDRKVLRKR
jgi:hypothetical protein